MCDHDDTVTGVREEEDDECCSLLLCVVFLRLSRGDKDSKRGADTLITPEAVSYKGTGWPLASSVAIKESLFLQHVLVPRRRKMTFFHCSWMSNTSWEAGNISHNISNNTWTRRTRSLQSSMHHLKGTDGLGCDSQ